MPATIVVCGTVSRDFAMDKTCECWAVTLGRILPPLRVQLEHMLIAWRPWSACRIYAGMLELPSITEMRQWLADRRQFVKDAGYGDRMSRQEG
jgi:hypothetical protein